MTVEPRPISLADVVRSAADQLRTLRADEVADPVIALESCEIELAVSTAVEPGGKINFYIFEVGTTANFTNSQKVVLTFKAIGDGVQAAAHGEGVADLPQRGGGG
jgi:hypothetical protein